MLACLIRGTFTYKVRVVNRLMSILLCKCHSITASETCSNKYYLNTIIESFKDSIKFIENGLLILRDSYSFIRGSYSLDGYIYTLSI